MRIVVARWEDIAKKYVVINNIVSGMVGIHFDSLINRYRDIIHKGFDLSDFLKDTASTTSSNVSYRFTINEYYI